MRVSGSLRQPHWPDILLITICVSLLAVELFVPPIIGLANNGDFGKVLGRLHLVTDTHKNLIFFVSKYQHTIGGWDSQLPMSELVLAKPAVWLASFVQRGQDFDIRYLTALHCLLFLAAFYAFLMLIRNLPVWKRLVLGAFVIWIFTDIAYTAYFSSFFGDTSAFLGVLLAVIAALQIAREPQSAWASWLIFASAGLLLIISKSQHALTGLALVSFPLWIVAKDRALGAHLRYRRSYGLLIAAVLLIAGAFELRATPSWYKSEAAFDIAFVNIPKTFPNHAQELDELKLSSGYQLYFGANVFQVDRGEVLQIYRKLGISQLARFYLRHPAATLKIIWGDLSTNTTSLRPLPLANYRQEDGFPPSTLTDHFCSWSNLRGWLFRIWPAHIVVWYALAIAGSWFLMLRADTPSARSGAFLCLCVCLMALVELAVASLGDGVDTRRHLFLFHALTDVTAVYALTALFLVRSLLGKAT